MATGEIVNQKLKCEICSRVFTSDQNLKRHVDESHEEYKGTETLVKKCEKSVWAVMNSDGQDPAVIMKAKVGLVFLGIAAKREQTQSAREATTVTMCSKMAENTEQFKTYLKYAMPSAPILKALPGGKPA